MQSLIEGHIGKYKSNLKFHQFQLNSKISGEILNNVEFQMVYVFAKIFSKII